MKLIDFVKKHTVIALIVAAFIFSMLLEVCFFVCGTVYVFSDQSNSLYKAHPADVKTVGYRQEGDEFFPESTDPQMIISGIDQNVQTLLISFGSTNHSEDSMQVYFKKAGENFTEENSIRLTVLEKAKYVAVSLPADTYDAIRIDIDGKFVLNDVVVSSGEITGTRLGFVNSFSFLRSLMIFALTAAISVSMLWAFRRFKASDLKLYDAFDKTRTFVLNRPALILVALLTVSSIVVFYDFLIKREIFIYSDIGSDTINVYYPFFMLMQRKLENLDFSLYDFSYGLGANVIGRQVDITSPFVWLILLFGRDEVKYLLPYSQILKIIISGIACYFYLDNFKLSKTSKILFSYAFAFNGFTMVWGQHYFFATASLCAVFILFGIERCLKKSVSGGLWLAFSVFYAAISFYYFAYMILIMSAIYTLIRMLYLYSLKELVMAIKKGSHIIGFVFLGLGMSAIAFLPAAYGILTSSVRVNNGVSLFDTLLNYLKMPCYDSSIINEIISKMFSSNLCGAGNYYAGMSNYYETPHFFFTSFLLFFALIFVLDTLIDDEINVKTKFLKLVASVLVLYLIVHPFLSVVMNGFVAHFFRYTFVLMPLFAWMCSYVLDKIFGKKLRFPKLQIAVSATVSLVLLSSVAITNAVKNPFHPVELAPVYVGMIFAAALIMCFIQDDKLSASFRNIGVSLVCVIMVANVMVDSNVSTNWRTMVSESNISIYAEAGDPEVEEALEYIESIDPSFYRVDKTFFGISWWNTAMLEGYNGVSVYNSAVNKNVIDFVDKACPELKSTFPYVDGYYDFTATYRNVNATSVMGVKYILSDALITDIPEYEYLTSVSDIHIYRNNDTQGIGRFYTSAIDYESFVALSQSERNSVLGSSIILDGLGASVNNGKADCSFDFKKTKSSGYIEGYISTSDDGWLMMAIPYDEGWKAYIDGVETPIVRGDIGFSAIEMPSGEHDVIFRYRTPLIVPGIVITVISFTVFAAFSVISVRSRRKQKASAEANCRSDRSDNT